MHMARGEIRMRRWNDPAQPGDGVRLLICRYRPRGVRKGDETWTEWWKDLAPSVELHAAAYGKGQRAISWPQYRTRFHEEMAHDPGLFHLRALIGRVAAGETVTLLCSSACTDDATCHRSLLRDLVLRALDAA
jgi:uncharacterized protein YeaO (DUF488 family)